MSKMNLNLKTASFFLYPLLIFLVSGKEYGFYIHRSSFPADFSFGSASSAYQIEGAAFEDGKGASIWDTFTHKYPEKIKDQSNGDIATDSYHRYKEDVAIMKLLGIDAYRFSISWSRILPRGHLSGGINQLGIDYYNNLIDELLLNGIRPFVTLFHWDLPEALEDEYGGFLSARVIEDFRNYAELCFSKFGDRVERWITLNEPLSYANEGYGIGIKAPGRCSKWVSPNCTGGDSSTEPYIVGHHLLLAHAAAVKVYRDKYQKFQMGQIGITLNCVWTLPMTDSSQDFSAASREIAFRFGWFMDPLNSGLYPVEMVTHVGKRLPQFSAEQSMMLKGSFDFIGLNYYTSQYATDVPCKKVNLSYTIDACTATSFEQNGIFIGPKTASDWLYIYPQGIWDVLMYMKHKYNNPVIYVTENGVSELDTGSLQLDDDIRVNYYNAHFSFIQKSVRDGVNVKGFFAWSMQDNFEWQDGYKIRFGIIYIDYTDGLKRHLKKSALWFKEFLRSGNQTQLNRRAHAAY